MDAGFDVIIIGAGPIGLACGIEAEKLGLKYLIIDKGTLVNSIYHYPLKMTFFSTSEKLEIGNVPFISHQHKPNRDEALEYYRRVALHWDLKIRLYESVEDIVYDTERLCYAVQTIKAKYHAKMIVLATGFYDLPHKMHIPGEDLPKVSHYYKEAHPYFGQKLAVIGASNSAVDAALECYRKGAEVTMIVRGDRIGDNVKYWVKPDIENRIKEGSISVFWNANVEAITEDKVMIRQNAACITLENDFVLALTGYEPDFSFLQRIGVEVAQNDLCVPVHNPVSMETNMKGIFLAGVICGGMETNKWFIENSRIHAVQIMKEVAERLA